VVVLGLIGFWLVRRSRSARASDAAPLTALAEETPAGAA